MKKPLNAFLVGLITCFMLSIFVVGIHPNVVADTTLPIEAHLGVAPSTVGIYQNVLMVMWVDNAPPSSSWAHGTGMDVSITRPNGSNITLGPFLLDENSSGVFMYVADKVGAHSAFARLRGSIGDVVFNATSDVVYFNVTDEPPPGYSGNKAYVSLSNTTSMPGESVGASIFFSAEENLKISGIGLYADWMPPDQIAGQNSTDNPFTLEAGLVHRMQITVPIPSSVPLGQHSYCVWVTGLDSTNKTFMWNSPQETLQVIAPPPTPTPSPTVQPTIQPTSKPTAQPTVKPSAAPKAESSIDISCKSSPTISNFKIDIIGHLSAGDLDLADKPVLLSYSVDSGQGWVPLPLVTTDYTGWFSAVWTPQVTGNYYLRAIYEGDATYLPITTTVQFAVLALEDNSVFSVTSNSTVSALSFNSTNQELTFKVSGDAGTTGYVDVNIAKSLIDDPSTLKVYLDGKQQSCISETQGDLVLVSFEYQHSTHEVTVELNNESATLTHQGYVIIAGVVVAVLVVVSIAVLIRRVVKKSNA
jgi:hypothetical protein